MYPTYDKRKEKVLAKLTEKEKWSLPAISSFVPRDFLPK